MKKKYIAEEIDMATYSSWIDGKKVIINAPTGAGKTTFILKTFLPYCQSRNKKMLILCNRGLLKEQYGFDLAERYERYLEMSEDVDVLTYQALSEKTSKYKEMKDMLQGYDVIVCDEVHYFYADSDFNADGTYVLLQGLVRACFFKTIIMITATIQEVLPLLERTFEQCATKLVQEEGEFQGFETYKYKKEIYDFKSWTAYGHLECFYAPDVETLADEIACSDKKTLVFIDDKQKAESFRKLLMKAGNLEEKDIYLLNAQVLDEKVHDKVIQNLAIMHRIIPKILITTSVLDNGVSLHDKDLGNVVIATDSRISFIQMLGRVRVESIDVCKLFIYPQSLNHYEKRFQQYEEKVRRFEELSKGSLDIRALEILKRGWTQNDEKAEFFRNAVVITNKDIEYYRDEFPPIYICRGEVVLGVNEFAREKAGNMLLTEKNFYRLAVYDTAKVAMEQISWLGKEKDELHIIVSSYKAKREALLKKCLLEINGYSLDELKEKKAEIAKEFRKDLLKDVITKGGSFSRDKLERICQKYGLCLEITIGTNKTNLYTVKEVEK